MLGSAPDAGAPGFGSVLFQPEIPVEPQSGQGKNKHRLAVGQVFGLIATACRRERVSASRMKDTQRQKRPGYIKEKKIILQ